LATPSREEPALRVASPAKASPLIAVVKLPRPCRSFVTEAMTTP
jgi:hypothetical protein